MPDQGADMPITVELILAALEHSKCLLLEGPPGTGKTRLLGELVAKIRAGDGPSTGTSTTAPLIDGRDIRQPFRSSSSRGIGWLPQPVRVEWTTFHQSYSYEDFIVGRRPKVVGEGMELVPVMGLLMDMAVSVGGERGFGSAVLVIDEINRANASRVLGEFITYMDPDYRAQVGGKPNPRALSVRLPGISYGLNNASEPIRRLDSETSVALSKIWSLPEHLYVVASMNSVDKAALPLDSALSRRFRRIKVRPSATALAGALNVDLSEARARMKETSGATGPDWSAEMTAVLLFERMNTFIRANLGEDFELGHSLLLPLAAADAGGRWRAFTEMWDNVVFPQLSDRFLGNRGFLREFLRLDETGTGLGAEDALGAGLAAAGRLSTLSSAEASHILQTLAR